jgi:MIP family channel proteins
MDIFRRSLAEFVGAFALTFIGTGAIMVSGAQGAGLVTVALAHGLVIAVFVSAVGHISGGHFNPAVTLGFVVTGRMKITLAAAYWIAQFGGAVIAALLNRWIFPKGAVDATHLGAPTLSTAIGSGAGFVVELILTFFLVFVIFATAADPRGTFKSIAGLAIGFTIALDIMMGGPLTGAAMNPSRAFGPQLVDDYWSHAWIWYAGPFLGGAAAALVYDLLYLRGTAPVPVGPPETGLDEPRPGDTAVS